MILTLDGLSFTYGSDSPVAVDSDGVEWTADTLTGWWTRPAARAARTARSSGPGSFRAVAWTGERIIGISGVIKAPSQALMLSAVGRLMAAASDPAALYEFAVDEGEATTTAAVEVDGELLTEFADWRSCRFSAQLAAPDPRRHDAIWQSPSANLGTPGSGGADFTAPGVSFAAPGMDFGTPGTPSAASVRNSGTATAYPFFTVTGPAITPQITDTLTGVTLIYAGSLVTGDVLTINTDEFPAQDTPGHSCYLNGTLNRRSSLLTPSGWPSVAPGASATYSLRAAGMTSATVTVALRSAWH